MIVLTALALAGDIDRLADEAVAANPGIEALEARTRQLEELAQVADLWPDPMLAMEYSNVPVNAPLPGNHPMSGIQLKAQQTLPAPGVTALRTDVAQGYVAISQEATREAELQLRKQVHQTWWRLALSRALGDVTEEHLGLTTELLDAVRSRYEVGSAGQSAVLRLELLRDRLGDEVLDYVRAETQLSAALVRALASDDRTFDTDPVEAVDVVGTVDLWMEQAVENRPLLAQLELMAQNAEQAAELALADARPDVTVWAGYRVRTQEAEGTDLISVGLSAPIPRNSSRRGDAVAAGHMEAAAAARAHYDAAEDMLHAQLLSAEAAWTRAAGKADTYETVLLPSAQSTLSTTLSDFRVGKADFASLYDAEVVLLALERARLTAAAETRIQHAEVEALIGAELSGGAP